MADRIKTTRRSLAARGLLALFLAAAVVASPDQTPAMFAKGFGLYVMLDGALALADAIGGAGTAGRRGLLALESAVDVIVGVVAFAWIGITGAPLLQLIGAWAVLGGVLRIEVGVVPERRIAAAPLVILAGVISWILGAFLIVFPTDQAADRVWAIALYALVLAVLRFGTAAIAWVDAPRRHGTGTPGGASRKISRPGSA